MSADDRMDMEGEPGSSVQKTQVLRRKATGLSLIVLGAVVGAAGVCSSFAAAASR